MSDSHVDRSDAVDPCLLHAVYVASPSPDPYAVTLEDPVAAPFHRCSPLTAKPPAEKPPLELDTPSPVVTTVLRLPNTPSPTMQRVDVSDSHIVPSHAETPTRILPLHPYAPIPTPCIVNRADPVVTPLIRLVALPDPPP